MNVARLVQALATGQSSIILLGSYDCLRMMLICNGLGIRQCGAYAQGLAAPLFASVALFGGYLLIKNFPAFSFQATLDVYFWLIGSFALAGGLAQPLRRLVRVFPLYPLAACPCLFLSLSLYSVQLKALPPECARVPAGVAAACPCLGMRCLLLGCC